MRRARLEEGEQGLRVLLEGGELGVQVGAACQAVRLQEHLRVGGVRPWDIAKDPHGSSAKFSKHKTLAHIWLALCVYVETQTIRHTQTHTTHSIQ